MTVLEFVVKLNKLGFHLTVKNESVILNKITGKLSNEDTSFLKQNAEITEYIRSNKHAIISHYTAEQKKLPAPAGMKIDSLYGLTPMQSGMLFHGLYSEKSTAYLQQFDIDLRGQVNIEILRRCWDHVVSMHSILRSGFHYEEFSVPMQCVYGNVTIPFVNLDLSSKSAEEQSSFISEFLRSDLGLGFDFRKAPLMRITVMKLSPVKYKMVWTTHHLIMDGWSLPILMQELLSAYEQISEGYLPAVKEDRYEDFIRYIEGRDKHSEEQFWRGYLAGKTGGTLLPFVRNRLDRNKGGDDSKHCWLVLDEKLTESIQRYAQSHRITINTVMQGVWSYILSKYTNSNDVVYGVTVSGRPSDMDQATERVGLYINTLPLRSKLESDKTVCDWLKEIQEGHSRSRDYQYTSLSSIQNWNGVAGDLFDSILVFENYPLGDVLSDKWRLKIGDFKVHEQTNYLLTLVISVASKLRIDFQYNDSLLSEEYVNLMKDHFHQVLTEFIKDSRLKISDVELVSDTERKQILEEFNSTAADYPKEKTLVDLFEAQAVQSQNAVAVVYEGSQLT